MRSCHGLSMKYKVTRIKKIRKMIEKWVRSVKQVKSMGGMTDISE